MESDDDWETVREQARRIHTNAVQAEQARSHRQCVHHDDLVRVAQKKHGDALDRLRARMERLEAERVRIRAAVYRALQEGDDMRGDRKTRHNWATVELAVIGQPGPNAALACLQARMERLEAERDRLAGRSVRQPTPKSGTSRPGRRWGKRKEKLMTKKLDLDGDQGYDEEYEAPLRTPEHPMPMQPIDLDENGTPRFRENRLVSYLLEAGGLDLNKLAIFAQHGRISNAELMQFAQLIGYSVSGAGSLPYFDRETKKEMDALAQELRLSTQMTTTKEMNAPVDYD